MALRRVGRGADACDGVGEGEILIQLVAGGASVMGPPPEVHTFIFPSLYDRDPDSPYGPIAKVLSYVR